MKATVLYQSELYGLKFWELKVEDGEWNHRIEITVNSMKNLGVATTLRSTKKLEAWLNETKQGQQYLLEYLAEKGSKKVKA